MHSAPNWSATISSVCSSYASAMPVLGTVTPVMRMFDAALARAFYVGFLGFELHWEHRFEENSPLYMELRRDRGVLHLSEHHGDATPGSAVRIEVADIGALHAELAARDYRFARPGLEHTPWQTREIAVTDPFGNRLHFFERLPAGRA